MRDSARSTSSDRQSRSRRRHRPRPTCRLDFTIHVPSPGGPRQCPARQRPVSVHEAAGQRDAVSRAVARDKPVATSVVIPR